MRRTLFNLSESLSESSLTERLITWKYNRYGHLEIWQGDRMDGEADIYIQADHEVETFFAQIGLPIDLVDPGDHDVCEDPGYF